MTSSELRARCETCEETWKIAQLPIGLDELATLCSGIRCTRCDGEDVYLLPSDKGGRPS